MAENQLQGIVGDTLDKIKTLIDVDTIIGKAITAEDGTLIIPVSKVSYGFASGGSDFPSKKTNATKELFGGGSGAGVTISPVGFLVIAKGDVKLLELGTTGTVDRIVAMVPELLEKLSATLKKKKDEKEEKDLDIEF